MQPVSQFNLAHEIICDRPSLQPVKQQLTDSEVQKSLFEYVSNLLLTWKEAVS